MRDRGVNTKVQAALQRKAAHAAEQDYKKAQKMEELEAEEWKKGSNQRSINRKATQDAKADELARRRKLKAELLASEELETSSVKVKKNTPSKKTKKKKNDLSILEDALISNADKKMKAKKREAKIKRDDAERREREKANISAQNTQSDTLIANTKAMIGDTVDGALVGRKLNLRKEEDGSSGIDGALSALRVDEDLVDAHPEKRMKALHKAFEEKMMDEIKEQYPGLRLNQYKCKIFNLWKKSPENPMNQKDGIEN